MKRYMCLYRDYFVHHRESEFRMETKRVDEPRLISGSYASIVEFNAVVCSGNIVPGPISVQPIVEILLNIKHIQLEYRIPFNISIVHCT